MAARDRVRAANPPAGKYMRNGSRGIQARCAGNHGRGRHDSSLAAYIRSAGRADESGLIRGNVMNEEKKSISVALALSKSEVGKRMGLRPHMVVMLTTSTFRSILLVVCGLIVSACDEPHSNVTLPPRANTQSSVAKSQLEAKPQSAVVALQPQMTPLPKEIDAVDLGSYPNIFQEFRECGFEMRYDVEQSLLTANPSYKIVVDQRIVKIKDNYAMFEAKGSFHGFPIVSLMIPSSMHLSAYELFRLELKGNVKDVREVLERDWDVNFEFRGPDDGPDVGDGPQVTYASEVWLSENQMFSRLRLFSQTEEAKETSLECDLKK